MVMQRTSEDEEGEGLPVRIPNWDSHYCCIVRAGRDRQKGWPFAGHRNATGRDIHIVAFPLSGSLIRLNDHPFQRVVASYWGGWDRMGMEGMLFFRGVSLSSYGKDANAINCSVRPIVSQNGSHCYCKRNLYTITNIPGSNMHITAHHFFLIGYFFFLLLRSYFNNLNFVFLCVKNNSINRTER